MPRAWHHLFEYIKLRFQLMSAQPIAKMHAEGEIQAWNCTDGHLLQPQPQRGK